MTKILILLSMISLPALSAQKNPVELGKVHWERDLALAREKSKQSTKPIFILFQEIPGCITCQRYGTQVLSHPLIVDALENEFIPLVIYNNKGGEDARVLKLFNEPAWNNPVVRIVDHQLYEIRPRLSGSYSPEEVTDYIISALKASHRLVPVYLDLLQQSFSKNIQTLTFGMFCFWEGEKKLGGLHGVLGTEPGYMNGCEVVKVKYDPDLISAEKIIHFAGEQNCSKQIFAGVKDISILQKINPLVKTESLFRPDKEPQYYLLHSNYKYLYMLPIQASRINSALALQKDPRIFLSPRQNKDLDYYSHNPSKGDIRAYHQMD